jgi:hypothetical protein
MKEWIARYQKAIVGTGAVSVLLICYFQQKELTKLRKEAKIQSEIKADKKTTDSLLNKLGLDHDNNK